MNIKKIIKYIAIPIIIGLIYFLNPGSFFTKGNETLFVSILIACFLIEYFIEAAKNGDEIYLRPISGLKAMEDAVGRATEMGKSVLYVPGISGLDQIDTLAGLTFLGHVSEMTSNYDTSLHVPVCTPIVMEAARETCKEAYLKSGHPDLFNDEMVQYIADDQFAYVAGVNGIMQREKPAACFYQGKFYAESLILAETGNSIGAIQIAGTGSPAQIPFFVTACDYTLIGEEFFAASSYLSKKPELIGSIKGQDYIKLFSMGLMALCLALSIFRFFDYSNTESWNETKNKYEYNQILSEWNDLDDNSKKVFSGFSQKENYKFELIKNSMLYPHYQAIDLQKDNPLTDIQISIIEAIKSEEELVNFFNDIVGVEIDINNMSNTEAEEFAKDYYNKSLDMYILDNDSYHSFEHLINLLFYSNIQFSDLPLIKQNIFKQSITIKSFDDLNFKNKVRLVNLFIGEKLGVSFYEAEYYPKELLSSVSLKSEVQNENIINKMLYVDDFSQIYNYIGEKQSSSFDVKELFNLKVVE